MSTAKFRNQITNFKATVQTRCSFITPERYVKFKYVVKPEDQLILDLIKNVDFEVLYQSKEFREMLDKRLEIKRLNGLIS